MKKITVLTAAFFAAAFFNSCAHVEPQENGLEIATVHNSRDSLEWWGDYQGVFQSESGMWVQKQLMLQHDGLFIMLSEYVSGDMPQIGSFVWNDTAERVIGCFEWNEAGNIITLEGVQPPYFLVGEGVVVQLRADGSLPQGDFANYVTLTQVTLPLH